MHKMILLITISFLFLSSCVGSLVDDQPKAVDGILDLSSWDFTEDGSVELSGEWEFYWNEHLASEDFSRFSDNTQKNFIHVPGAWNGYNINGGELAGEGFATYKLTILPGENKVGFAFYFPDIGTAFSVYVNGKKISSVGVAGKSLETTIPQYLPHIKPFTSDGNRLEIILHVSNFHHRLGGVWFPVQFGLAEQIRLRRTTTLMRDFVLVGSFLFMGLYHLGMFLFRRVDKAALYLAAGCFLITLRTLVTGEMFLFYLVSEIPWVFGIRLEYLSYYMAISVFSMFLKSIFPDEFSRKALKVFVSISVLFSLLVALTSSNIFTHTIPAFNLFTLVFFVFGIYSVVRAVIRKREGSVIIFIGLLILFLTSINDILYNFNLVNTGYFIAMGFLGFIFSQAVFLSKRFSMTFNRLEVQSKDLLEANNAYEKELYEHQLAEEALKKTENLRVEKEAAETSNRMKSDFLANMSHEIRTPMNAIIGFSEILSGQEEDYEKKEMLEIIKKAGRSLLTLINDILDFSRIEAGKVDVEKINFSLASLINHMENMFAAKNWNRKLSFKVIMDKSVSVIVVGDEHRISQILLNLLGNAFKFTKKGGITLTCGYNAQRAVISVTDTGIGITDEKIETIFCAFSQADSSTVRLYGGTGLGLAISRQLAELMGGSLTVCSRIGEGSVFTLELPLPEFTEVLEELEELPPETKEPAGEETEMPAHTVNASYKILLAEDNKINQFLVKSILKSIDLDCDIAEDGRIALDKLARAHYDLLLLDIQMPVMDGLETIKYIRSDENLKDLHVIALTANAMQGDAEKYIKVGCNDYISKPIDRELFLRKLSGISELLQKS